jgi:tetratricopeptide (TPR) repeat protein
VDRRRLADVRAGTADEQRSGGSGYVVGQQLVLTCRHVIADDQGRAWSRLEIWLGHPGDGAQRRVAAQVAWVHPDQDAALLRIEGEPFTGKSPVRWGWFASNNPAPYTGLGYPLFANYEVGRGVEQLRGNISPLSVGPNGAYVLDQAAAPETAPGRSWRGVSGTAVFCQELLTGIVVNDDRDFGNWRLHAVPTHAITADPEFRHLITHDTGAPPIMEAVEFQDFLQPPVNPTVARTPGSLLAASVEAVDFSGRGDELAELASWRDNDEVLSIMLVGGEGGQGKTRLARRFAAQTRDAGWVVGLLAARTVMSSLRDTNDQQQAIVELAKRVRQIIRPVLLVADYAETRPDEIIAIADILASNLPAHPARLLLLSRAAGSWWNNLTDVLGEGITSQITLKPLTTVGQLRQDAYALAVTGLARRLAMLPDQPTEEIPRQTWSVIAEELAGQPPVLDDPRMGNALTLQITALTDLLTAASGQIPEGDYVERELVRHEIAYLRRAAVKRSLFSPGILSNRADRDDRLVEVWAKLEQALAAVILLGPCDGSWAQVIGQFASVERAGDVVNWLAALYPPSGEESGLGLVQPDRLAELMLGPILIRQTDLISHIGTAIESAEQAHTVLFMLLRTAAHSDFNQIGEQVSKLIAGRPDPFAVTAPVLAAALPHSAPLRTGLFRLGKQDPQMFARTAYAAIDQLPKTSITGIVFSAALTEAIVDTLRPLAAAMPDEYLPALALALSNFGARLAAVGQKQAALAPAQEAVEIYRKLAEANPASYLSGLADSLNNLGTQLGEAGQRQAALFPAQEAVTISRQLAANSDTNLPRLAMTLANLGIWLADAGQLQAALTANQEAVDICRQLARANPGSYLPELAQYLSNLGTRLTEIGQRQAALAPAQEAADILRQLVVDNADAYLPDLGKSLRNVAFQLVRAGQLQAAIAPSIEAAQIFRELAVTYPDVYLPDLAGALATLGAALMEAGQLQAALGPTQEAADIYKQLAADDPRAYLPDLAWLQNNLGMLLADVGQLQNALLPAQEAVTIRRRLVVNNSAAHLSDLARSLKNLADLLAEAGQFSDALTTSQEATDIFHRLAADNPAAYLSDLAGALGNLGKRLADTGQRQAALDAAQQAADIYRQLAADNPLAYLPDLAGALGNLGNRLADTGQHQAALDAALQAADIYRQLAGDNPAAYLPGLASVLKNLANELADTGQRQAALDAALQAADIYRQLAADNPAAYQRGLASALNNLGNRLADTGQRQAALDAAQQAADIYRQLAADNPLAYLSDLAKALGNLGNRLADTGQRQAALDAAQQAADIYRQLAADNPAAYLPDAAATLHNLSFQLSRTGQHLTAVTAARQAADIFRQLAADNPAAYQRGLNASVANLADRLSEADRDEEAVKMWESALAGSPNQSSRLALIIAYARYLLAHEQIDAAVAVLAEVLNSVDAPGPMQAEARVVLRIYWRANPRSTERAWQSVSQSPLPDWIQLTDDQIKLVIEWLNAKPWTRSRNYLEQHSTAIHSDATNIVLDELSLGAPANLINQYRTLLNTVRIDGLEVAYRPLLLTDVLAEWMATPDWDSSRAYLNNHPELLSDEIPGILDRLHESRGAEATVHQALLILIDTLKAVDSAYEYLTNEVALHTAVMEAIASRDAVRMQAYAAIESLVHGQTLSGGIHIALAQLLNDPTGPLPDALVERLRGVAARVDPAERERAAAELRLVLANFPPGTTAVEQLQRALG